MPGGDTSETSATAELLDWLVRQRLYSVPFGLTQDLVDQLAALPASAWQPVGAENPDMACD